VDLILDAAAAKTRQLLCVELPNALYVILAGIRTSTVINVSAVMSFLDRRWGGRSHLSASPWWISAMLAGAVPTAVLATRHELFMGRIGRGRRPGLAYSRNAAGDP
jgi:osmoprotectant transport system permease protein